MNTLRSNGPSAEVLYEDDAVLVCRKPAGLAVQTAKAGQQDLVSQLKNYLGSPYLGVVHRLDQPVEGLLVFGKNRRSAGSLSAQLAAGALEKSYLAVVWGKPDPPQGELVDYLYKNPALGCAVVCTGRKTIPKEAKRAVLCYRTIRTLEDPAAALLEIRISTGRFHQIRAQMAHAGYPLFADHKYGPEELVNRARELGGGQAALCAARLAFSHPMTGKPLEFSMKPNGIPFSWFCGQAT